MRYKLTAVNLYGKTEMAMGQLWLPLLPGSQLGLLPRQLSASVKKPNNCSIAAGEEGQPKLPHRHFRFAVEIHSGEFVTHRFTFCSFEVN